MAEFKSFEDEPRRITQTLSNDRSADASSASVATGMPAGRVRTSAIDHASFEE
jgi:hypothetical protein